MTGLNRAVLLGGLDDGAALLCVCRQRLLDQAGDPAGQERLGDLAVKLGGHGDGDGADTRQQRVEIRDGLAAVVAGDLGGLVAVHVEDADELRPRHLGVDARVQPTHAAAADDGDGSR
jgi:hypothetical protein